MKPSKFEDGQEYATSWGSLPVTVKILKRTPKSVRIHVKAEKLIENPEGEEFTRKLIIRGGYEALFPLGPYLCHAPSITVGPNI